MENTFSTRGMNHWADWNAARVRDARSALSEMYMCVGAIRAPEIGFVQNFWGGIFVVVLWLMVVSGDDW